MNNNIIYPGAGGPPSGGCGGPPSLANPTPLPLRYRRGLCRHQHSLDSEQNAPSGFHVQPCQNSWPSKRHQHWHHLPPPPHPAAAGYPLPHTGPDSPMSVERWEYLQGSLDPTSPAQYMGGEERGNSFEDIYCSSSGADTSTATKKYEVLKPLGVGTYGKVKLTKDVFTDQLFAVKTINVRKLADSAEDLASIRREIEIMCSLHHPNIIHIREVLENHEAIVIVMECAQGGELFQYLHKVNLLSEHEARRLFRQTVSALFYCHSKMIAHRDLKLENILLDQHINVKIADFGLSSPFSYSSHLTTFCGSPLYAAPEIVTGTPYHGPEIDCWSLGVILYILVYGKMPFEAPEGHNYLSELCRKITAAEYPEPAEPSSARDLIRLMLCPNPGLRGTIQDIAHHWWLNVNYNLPVTHLPENSSAACFNSHNFNRETENRGSYKRKRHQKTSYNQVFPKYINIYKAETIDFSEEVSILGNARPRLEESLRVMEPDETLINKQCILKKTKHKYEGNDSGCVLEENSEILLRDETDLESIPSDVCVLSGDEGISEPRYGGRRRNSDGLGKRALREVSNRWSRGGQQQQQQQPEQLRPPLPPRRMSDSSDMSENELMDRRGLGKMNTHTSMYGIGPREPRASRGYRRASLNRSETVIPNYSDISDDEGMSYASRMTNHLLHHASFSAGLNRPEFSNQIRPRVEDVSGNQLDLIFKQAMRIVEDLS